MDHSHSFSPSRRPDLVAPPTATACCCRRSPDLAVIRNVFYEEDEEGGEDECEIAGGEEECDVPTVAGNVGRRGEARVDYCRADCGQGGDGTRVPVTGIGWDGSCASVACRCARVAEVWYPRPRDMSPHRAVQYSAQRRTFRHPVANFQQRR